MSKFHTGETVHDTRTGQIGKIVACSDINTSCVIVDFQGDFKLSPIKALTSLASSTSDSVDVSELGSHLSKMLENSKLKAHMASVLGIDGTIYGIEWIPYSKNFEVFYKADKEYKTKKISKNTAKDVILKVNL